MAQAYPLPKWGLTMEEGTITEWNVKPGDAVTEGQVVAVVATDKIEVELESPVGGVFAKTLADEGDDVLVGADVMVIATDQADYESYAQGA